MNIKFVKKSKSIRFLVLDSDGVLTDGGVFISEEGKEMRRFNIKDGLGIRQMIAAGIKVAVISGSSVEAVRHRVQKLGIEEIYLGIEDKLPVIEDLAKRYNVTFTEIAYMGDDVNDIAILERVGLSCAPADASATVLDMAEFVTKARGGHGAVRELCDAILSSKMRGN